MFSFIIKGDDFLHVFTFKNPKAFVWICQAGIMCLLCVWCKVGQPLHGKVLVQHLQHSVVSHPWRPSLFCDMLTKWKPNMVLVQKVPLNQQSSWEGCLNTIRFSTTANLCSLEANVGKLHQNWKKCMQSSGLFSLKRIVGCSKRMSSINPKSKLLLCPSQGHNNVRARPKRKGLGSTLRHFEMIGQTLDELPRTEWSRCRKGRTGPLPSSVRSFCVRLWLLCFCGQRFLCLPISLEDHIQFSVHGFVSLAVTHTTLNCHHFNWVWNCHGSFTPNYHIAKLLSWSPT